MKHIFDVEIARKYGVNCAVIMENMFFWIEKNRANATNFYDGKYWTFNSKKALTELFPYLTQNQIEYSINKLEDEGILVKGNYNKSPFDKTTWYAFTDFGLSIFKNSDTDLGKFRNRETNIPRPIPYINDTDINTDINKENICISSVPSDNTYTREKQTNKRFVKPSVEEVSDYVRANGYQVDAESFVSFYESKGWRVGKEPMKDWKASVRYWNSIRKRQNPPTPLANKPTHEMNPNYRENDTWDVEEMFK